jgi:hypothetical protein
MALIDTDIKGVTCEEGDIIKVRPRVELRVSGQLLAPGTVVRVPADFGLIDQCELAVDEVVEPEPEDAEEPVEEDKPKAPKSKRTAK